MPDLTPVGCLPRPPAHVRVVVEQDGHGPIAAPLVAELVLAAPPEARKKALTLPGQGFSFHQWRAAHATLISGTKIQKSGA